MAIDYQVKLLDRTNESNNHTFTKGVDIASLAFEDLKVCGSGPFSLRAYRSDWSAIESLVIPENLVEISIDLGGGMTLAHTGIVQSVGDVEATPPDCFTRTIKGWGLWSELSREGCLVLRVFDSETQEAVNQMVSMMILYDIAPWTDISNAVTEISIASPYSVVRAIFEDKPAASCIKLCAELQGDIVYGVGADRKLYFRDEVTTNLFTVRLGDKDDGITSFKPVKGRPGPNYYIIQGRESKSGNPMTVVVDDVDAGQRRRVKVLKAPNLVAGADMITWGQHLAALSKIAPQRMTIPIADLSDVVNTPIDTNRHITVNDKDGVKIDDWAIRSVKYMLSGGVIKADIEVGTALAPDISDEFRRLLQDIQAQKHKEFSNAIEIAAGEDEWKEIAYRFFVQMRAMRNSWRASLDRHLALDLDHADTSGLILDAYDTGITADAGGGALGTFVTKSIPIGMAFEKFAVKRQISYPVYIHQQDGSGLEHFQSMKGDTGFLKPVWEAWPTPHSFTEFSRYIVPTVAWPPVTGNYDGFLMLRNALSSNAEIIYDFGGDLPRGDPGQTHHVLVFNFEDADNYYCVLFLREFPLDHMRWYLGRRTGGNWDWAYNSPMTGCSDHNLWRVTVTTYPSPISAVMVTVWNRTLDISQNWTSTWGWWAPTDDMTRAGFRWRSPQASPTWGSDWRIYRLTFDNCAAGNSWQLSRDGGTSWEGTFNPDTGAEIDLGTYAGGGTANDELLVKGYTAFPQITTGIGAGWKE